MAVLERFYCNLFETSQHRETIKRCKIQVFSRSFLNTKRQIALYHSPEARVHVKFLIKILLINKHFFLQMKNWCITVTHTSVSKLQKKRIMRKEVSHKPHILKQIILQNLLNKVLFLFDSLCPSQQFFRYVRMGLHGLNQF